LIILNFLYLLEIIYERAPFLWVYLQRQSTKVSINFAHNYKNAFTFSHKLLAISRLRPFRWVANSSRAPIISRTYIWLYLHLGCWVVDSIASSW